MSKYRVFNLEKPLTIDVSENDTTVTGSLFSIYGLLRSLKVKVPQLAGTTTVTVSLLDGDGKTVYTKASIAENDTTYLHIDANNHPLQIALAGEYKLQVVASSAQASDQIVTTTLYIDRG